MMSSHAPYLGKSVEVVETRGGGDGDGGGRRVLAVAAGTAARARPEAVGHEGCQVAPSLLAVDEFNGRKSSTSLQHWAKTCH